MSQEDNWSLVNLETLLRRGDLSFIKLGQRSKKWQAVSMSKPQLQIGLSESRKPCLNLWSRRWLKPSRNLVRCLIPLVLKQLYVVLGEDLKNFRILFIKILKLSEFRIDLSRLFHLIITEGKKELLKRLCLKGKRGIFLDDLVLWDVVWRGSSS